MIHLNRKSKIAFATIVAIAVVMMIAVPLASAQVTEANAASNLKTITAHGNIYQVIDNETIKYYPADLTLTLQPTSTNGTIKRFSVVEGTLTANGVSYAFTNGNGAVLPHRHIVLLQAQGTTPEGQTVTLRLGGLYAHSWAEGQPVLRIGARLLTDDANYTLRLKAAI